ncbi:hypothetical protein HWB51_gp043 [Mycobacterium phage Cuke]|uniref:Uncharacterized protein n=1 Tax=Mycobacterium phage Cuke TaxID=2079417 RepID=A0A2L1IWU9_9CAUD|nr:hypothetical protein HWB51_gp043 [Mycobacterium phage Cuke]AVD99661.1 hypothetical protein SEA_CUKE_43 [Mycobacterium phage Cuke]
MVRVNGFRSGSIPGHPRGWTEFGWATTEKDGRAMDKIVDLSTSEATALLRELELAKAQYGLHKLAVCIDGPHVKFKVNEHTWSPPMGTLRESE